MGKLRKRVGSHNNYDYRFERGWDRMKQVGMKEGII